MPNFTNMKIFYGHRSELKLQLLEENQIQMQGISAKFHFQLPIFYNSLGKGREIVINGIKYGTKRINK